MRVPTVAALLSLLGEPSLQPEGGEGGPRLKAGDDPRPAPDPVAVVERSAAEETGSGAAGGRGRGRPGGAAEDSRAERRASAAGDPPPPRVHRARRPEVRVAVGFSPEAVGNRNERRIVESLAAGATRARGLVTRIRRLRVGSRPAREVCREGRDDLVIQVGYVPGRKAPVLLPYDCLLRRALGVRGPAAAGDPGLVEELWKEHERLVAAGVRPRRRLLRLGPKARAALIGTTVVLVLGAAVAVLLVGALRKEQVVLKVHP